MQPSNLFSSAFEVFQHRESYLKRISNNQYPAAIIIGQILLIAVFTFFYGLIMGSYHGFAQAMMSGIKIWALFLLTLAICLPSFYIVQIVLGSRVGLKQLTIMLLSGLVMVSTIMLAFGPIVLFFQLSGGNYNFLQLLHVGIMIFSGVFGMRVVLDALRHACENQAVYPKIGLSVFKIWVIIFALVGFQLSWNLRPFLGQKEKPFEIVRSDTRGNVYSAIFRSMGSLMGIDANSFKKKKKWKKQKSSVDAQAKQPDTSTGPVNEPDSLQN